MAAAVGSVAHRRKMDVPRQLTFVGFDDTIPAVTLWPPLTTVHQPVRKLAADALALLAAHVSKPAEKGHQPREHLLPHTIVHRRSATGPLISDGEVSSQGAAGGS